jgi:hypothetical protein
MSSELVKNKASKRAYRLLDSSALYDQEVEVYCSQLLLPVAQPPDWFLPLTRTAGCRGRDIGRMFTAP